MIEPGSQLGKYHILEKLGAGGMADVWLAEDTTLKRQVALKVLPPEFARDPERAARFEKEVLNSASLQHPGIVTIHDVGHEGGVHYYTMTLLPGGDLKQKIRTGLSPQQALQYLRQLADALDHAHCKGFVHRDLKPENIMFDGREQPVITDFGIAKAVGSGTKMTGTGMSIGTPHYMSPEQAQGLSNLDGRSDLYSLGIILYEMLTGQVPFDADNTVGIAMQHVQAPLPTLPQTLGKLQPLLDRLLAKDPSQRYGNAGELVQAIDTVLAGQSLPGVSSAPAPKTQVMTGVSATPAAGQGGGLKWALVGALLAAVLVGGFVLLNNGGRQQPVFAGGGSVTSADSSPTGSVKPRQGATVAQPVVPELTPEQKKQKKIQTLLASAKKDLDALRLTKPEGENALEKYQRVLKLDSHNDKALDGYLEILNRYDRMLAKARVAGKMEKFAGLCQGPRKTWLSFLRDPDFKSGDELERRIKAYFSKVGADPAGSVTCIDADHELFDQLLLEDNLSAAEAELRSYKQYVREYLSIVVQKRLVSEKDAAASIRRTFADVDRKLAEAKAKQHQAAIAAEQARKAQEEARRRPATFTDPTTGMEFVLVKGGCFQMGSNDGNDDEKPVHEVCVNDFYMGKYEVTQKQYLTITGRNPSDFRGDNRPVEQVSWSDAQSYIRQLNSRSGKNYRLPTEAEWEYACRSGGKDEKYCGGNDVDALAWYEDNSGRKTYPVGQKQPNGLGLYDMSGNVWEWCQDWYGDYPSSTQRNPQGPRSGSYRVDRGGGWDDGAGFARADGRGGDWPGLRDNYLGFRLAFPTGQ